MPVRLRKESCRYCGIRLSAVISTVVKHDGVVCSCWHLINKPSIGLRLRSCTAFRRRMYDAVIQELSVLPNGVRLASILAGSLVRRQ